jgi:osmotically-inducible protein OsmY
MYFLDPRLGRYRRGVARDRAVSFAHRSVVLAEKQALNARNHLRGALAEAQQLIRLEEPVSDRKLGERVRSRIGRVTPQASTIELDVHAGVVVAKGRLKREHAQRVLSAISRVRGVTAVKDRIERIPLQEG